MKHFLRMAKIAGVAYCAMSATTALADSAKGRAYRVHVFTSFSTDFDDCFVFEGGKTLTIAGYGSLVYRLDDLNTQSEDWQATPRPKPPGGFGLSFHGTFGGSAGKTLTANGVSSEGNTFVLQGTLNSDCVSRAGQRPGASPYNP